MKKTKAIIITLFFAFLFLSTASAEICLKAEVDKTSLTVGETLTYKITINSMGKEQLKPKIPKFDGFRVISSMQSSKMSFVKNSIQRNIVYIFILAPTTIGNFKIGPATIKIEDKIYSTDTFEIEVKEKPSLPEQRQPESESPQVTL